MKIALVIPTMDRGGAEKQVVLLAKGLHELGHDVRVFLLTRDGHRSEDLRAAGVPVVLIGKRFKMDPTALFRLKKQLVDFAPDIVHTWLFAANSFGRVAAKWAGVPVIIASERCVDPWKTGWHFLIDRRLQKISQAITTNSSGVQDFYAANGLDPAQFVVIPNGVESIDSTKTQAIDREEAFRRLEVASERRLIVAVGRLWPQKRIRDLIWAGELLATARGDTTLVVIGDGPQREELLRHRDSVSAPLHVRFAGQREDVGELLPHADQFWIASEYEGQSNAVIEAMLAGVPVIASNIPGNRDLVIDKETGWLFDVGDEADLVRLSLAAFNDPDGSQRIAEQARQHIVDEFSLDAMIRRHVMLYEKLLVGHDQTRS
ncbi:MAG TPA: glycosyl transferase family 1 [Rhodopirellula baltica]|uniref:Glycosyl transferase n=1 Tax=Rhodopirellula baltica (strain DSM 10527 / NCIMB 13988 / SH1) TaxID=243090 RepID=Q7UQ48_RHOBA|nr:glycosyltransferase [Rhodopirellula baltica]CAD74857.1 putative glycosyl transferase [Rhodopirellula baltica SH 1]HBE62602.1 glycosyl transferase family 1 [Rhodopirellula baltica]